MQGVTELTCQPRVPTAPGTRYPALRGGLCAKSQRKGRERRCWGSHSSASKMFADLLLLWEGRRLTGGRDRAGRLEAGEDGGQ